MATIHLIHGFVGYGKTTFAKKLSEETEGERFTHDEWMNDLYGSNPPPEQFQAYCDIIKIKILEMVELIIKTGQDVILDFGFWTRKERDEYRQKAKDLNADCIIYTMDCNLETAKERVSRKGDTMQSNGVLFIEDNAMEKLWKGYEPLEEDEECIVIDCNG